MSAKSSKGVVISMTPSEATTSAVKITSMVSSGNGVVITLGGTSPPELLVGDIIHLNATGFSGASGKAVAVTDLGDVSDSYFVGNLSLGSGTLQSTATCDIYSQDADVCLCLNSFSIQKDTPSTISVGTYCDPTASLPASVVSAGSVSFGGYIDIDSGDYPALLQAEEDSAERILKITFPQNQGFVVAPMIVASLAYDIPLDGGLGYNGAGTLTSNSRHYFGKAS